MVISSYARCNSHHPDSLSALSEAESGPEKPQYASPSSLTAASTSGGRLGGASTEIDDGLQALLSLYEEVSLLRKVATSSAPMPASDMDEISQMLSEINAMTNVDESQPIARPRMLKKAQVASWEGDACALLFLLLFRVLFGPLTVCLPVV